MQTYVQAPAVSLFQVVAAIGASKQGDSASVQRVLCSNNSRGEQAVFGRREGGDTHLRNRDHDGVIVITNEAHQDALDRHKREGEQGGACVSEQRQDSGNALKRGACTTCTAGLAPSVRKMLSGLAA